MGRFFSLCESDILVFLCSFVSDLLHLSLLIMPLQRFCVIQDESGDEVFRVDCGGGHRSWDVVVSGVGASREIRFYYVKDGSLLVESTPSSCIGSPVTIKVLTCSFHVTQVNLRT